MNELLADIHGAVSSELLQGIQGRPLPCLTMPPNEMRHRSSRMVTSMDAARLSNAASVTVHLRWPEY